MRRSALARAGLRRLREVLARLAAGARGLAALARRAGALRLGYGFSLLVGIAACALPLLGTYGPESALLFALTLAPWAGGLGARVASAGAGKPTAGLIVDAIAISWRLLAVPVGALALNALRVHPCDPFGGLRFIALGPWAGVTLAALLGVALGTLLRSARAAAALAALAPLFEVARAGYRFVATPAIFAFGHFFGYFPGTFYDRQIDVPSAWLSHRLLSALIAAGLWALLSAARDPETGRLAPARLRRAPGSLALGCALAAASAIMAREAFALHHATSAASIAERLGLAVDTARCRVLLPRETPRGAAQRLAEDCEFRVRQLERLLEVKERERITAFFFRSPQEKRTLMGAARVYIAKPWRREVYLQLSDYPHPVLAHELAHVVARHASRGPLGVPGRLFGLIPEPTLVEGMAVALEPHARDELTPDQWAKAAYDARVAPPLSALSGARFLGANAALAYTLAGSFLRFVLDSRGAAALRRVYALGSVEEALSSPLSALEREWRARLARVPLPERAAQLARQRFERPGVLSQVCPHLVEQLTGELGAALSAGDLARAADKCREVLAVDAHDTQVRATLTGVLAHSGAAAAAHAELKRLEGPPRAPAPTLARARAALADASFERGDYTHAELSYRALLHEPQPDDDLRQLEVKLLALSAGEPGRSLLRELLISHAFRSLDPRSAMHLIRELAPTRQDGLALYLEARQLLIADRYDLALELLRGALARGLPTQRLKLEALRMHALAAYVTGSLSEAEASAGELERRDGASLADRLEARDLRERIAFRRGLAGR